MPVLPSWQAWRLASLPTAESVLGHNVCIYPLRQSCRSHRRSRWSHPSVLARPLFTAQCEVDPVDLESAVRRDAIERTDEYVTKETKDRQAEINQVNENPYPRYSEGKGHHPSLGHYHAAWNHLKAGEVARKGQEVEVQGRIQAIRRSGRKLAFVDIVEGRGRKLQILLNQGALENRGVGRDEFTSLVRLLRRGDVISITGQPHRTESGELSIKAISLPRLLAPCLHQFPTEPIPSSRHVTMPVTQEAQQLDRHVEMLTSDGPIQTLLRRAELLQTMRLFFAEKGFVEVQTPILAASAGGAVARPFETAATEFADRKLSLRVAPELWLKRLIIGGMSKIYEIGPSFRNEGLDKTHNPEFTTCEFYQTYTSLPQLLQTTEALLSTIARRMSGNLPNVLSDQKSIPKNDVISSQFEGPYPKIDFILGLNAALKVSLPNLDSPTACNDLLAIFEEKNIPVPPTNPTLPRLLDKLSSIYLEPVCNKPTWIVNIPECLSPLSKSFIHPTAPNKQPVAARAELFVQGKEVVNCYEEENSPWEQRRKFMMQQAYAKNFLPSENTRGFSAHPDFDPETMKIDEDYLRALEWGLPPTGGWGCGVDRLVMLFTGRDRIGDVLSFGNLRRVTRGAEKRERSDTNLVEKI